MRDVVGVRIPAMTRVGNVAPTKKTTVSFRERKEQKPERESCDALRSGSVVGNESCLKRAHPLRLLDGYLQTLNVRGGSGWKLSREVRRRRQRGGDGGGASPGCQA